MQTPVWSSYEILQSIERSTIRHGGQRLDVLVRRSGDQKRPVLVLVPGSVCMPAFMVSGAPGTDELMTSAVLPKPASQDAMGVHLAILERRNIVSLDRFFRPQDVSPILQLEQNPCTQAFGGSTLGQRTEDTLAQIAHIRRQPWAGDILLAGMSEGSDVVAAAAATAITGIRRRFSPIWTRSSKAIRRIATRATIPRAGRVSPSMPHRSKICWRVVCRCSSRMATRTPAFLSRLRMPPSSSLHASSRIAPSITGRSKARNTICASATADRRRRSTRPSLLGLSTAPGAGSIGTNSQHQRKLPPRRNLAAG
jgi:hypothetical protein